MQIQPPENGTFSDDTNSFRQRYRQMRKQRNIFDGRWSLDGFIDPYPFDRHTTVEAAVFDFGR